jgi:hypothetical protein
MQNSLDFQRNWAAVLLDAIGGSRSQDQALRPTNQSWSSLPPS